MHLAEKSKAVCVSDADSSVVHTIILLCRKYDTLYHVRKYEDERCRTFAEKYETVVNLRRFNFPQKATIFMNSIFFMVIILCGVPCPGERAGDYCLAA